MHSTARDFTLNLAEELFFPLRFLFCFLFFIYIYIFFGVGEGGNYLMARTWATSLGGNHAQQPKSDAVGRLREILFNFMRSLSRLLLAPEPCLQIFQISGLPNYLSRIFFKFIWGREVVVEWRAWRSGCGGKKNMDWKLKFLKLLR